MKRIEKLGISKDIDPDDLNPTQMREFCRLNINNKAITWNRVMDVNDRFLRKITIGQAKTEKGYTREVSLI